MRIATRKSAEEHTKSIVLYDLRKDNTHIARRTRSAQRAMSHQYYKSVPVKQEECIIEFHDTDAEYDIGKLAMSEVKEIKVEKSVSPMEGRKQCRPRKCERDRDRIQEDAIELHDSDSEYDCGKPAMCEVKEIKVENSVSPMERRKHGRPRKCERDWDRKQEEDIIEFHDTDTEYDSGKPAMSEVKEIKLEKSVSPMERRKWGRPRKCERDRGKIQEDITEFHDTDTEYDSGKPAMSEVKQIKVEKFVSPMEQTMERRKWGRPRKCKRDRDKIQEDLSEFHDTDTEYDSGKLAMSEVKEINIEKFVSPMEQRKRGRPRKCERDRNRIPEDLIGFHDTDTEYDSGKPAMSKVTEIKVEKSVSHMERRKRGRPRKCERDRNRVSENGMKHINVKSQDWLKNHNKQDSLVRDIQKLVEVEVKKQITKLVNLTAGEKWEQFFHKNAKIGLNIQKSRMEELRTSDVRRKRPLQMSDSEDEVLEADLHLYTQRKMSEIESLQELVTMQCIAKIGENQQSYGSSSYIELDKVTEDKKGNNVKEAMKKQNSRVPVPVFEENDLPFQDFVLDTEAKSESPSKHDDLHDMWKNMDMTSKGEGNIDMEERKSPKIVGRVKDEGTEEKLSLSRLGDVKSSKASKDPYVSTEIKKAVNGKSDINSKTRPKKCSRDCRPVVVEVTKSPFMCVLLDIEAEANIPTTLENVFPNQKTLQEDRDLEDMWKDMELAFNGNTLNSGNVMNHKIAEDFPDAELDLNDMYCMGEHVFVLDEEIGLICKICKFVKQEIDSILPSMIADSGRNQSRKDYVYVEDMSCSPNLHIEDHCENSASESCPPEHSVWNLIPSLKENMYAHQQEAFEFLWRNIGGALTPENLKLPTSDEVGGCIISHAPGTGKTFLIISFLKTYLELFPRSRPLIIAPKNMLFPWEREFRKWSIDIPVYMLNRSKIFWNEIHSNHEYVEIINMVKSYQIMGKRLKNLRRLVMLREWYRRRSVLLISYNLFAYLTCEKNESLPEEAKHIGKLLLESPGLLVLDEGHQARNNQSKIWNSLKKVKTKLRIILSGTLFQNNFRELFNTLYLVRPTFVDRCLGKSSKLSSTSGKVMGDSRIHRLRKFFMDEIGNKIQNGKEYGKVEFDETLAKFRFMTDYFVHCYDGKILNSLPGIKDFTVILRPSSIQQTVLDHINEANNHDRASNFEFETMVSCVSIHPSLYRDFGIKRLSSGIDSSRLEAIRKYPYEGVKSKFVLDLVSLSKVMEEKVLLFSQNIPPLNFLMDMFETHFSWSKGKEIFQLDGTLPLDERQSIIDQFNDPRGEARVLCASIKTCSEGITLTGASRVVFLDLVWNPAIVKQALSRAFRLGQKKCVYIYRLIASGTMEEEKYERTVWKDCLSTLVFVSPHEREDVDASDCTQNIHFEDKILNKLVELDRETKAFLTIFEHSELKGKRDPRSEFFQEYHNLKDKFHIFVG